MNPFVFGTVVTGNDFINRKEIIKILKDDLPSGINILIYGDRKIGKTSLVVETLRRMGNMEHALVDLLGITSVQDFCERYINAMKNLENKNYLQKAGKILSSLRPRIKLENNGSPVFTIEVDNGEERMSLSKTLKMPVKLMRKGKKAAIILDEFQDILNIKEHIDIESVMRGVIQHHRDISYVFLGSRKHIMKDMFTSRKRPFYDSAKTMLLENIDIGYYYDYLKKKFSAGGRKISEEEVALIYQYAEGIPNDIHRLCHAIWETTDKNMKISNIEIEKGIDRVCCYQQDLFEDIYKNLSLYQNRVLSALAIEHKVSSVNAGFIRKYRLSSPQTVYKALKALQKREIILEKDGSYKISLPFFKFWIAGKKR